MNEIDLSIIKREDILKAFKKYDDLLQKGKIISKKHVKNITHLLNIPRQNHIILTTL